MRILIIGLGSIGIRHYKILKKLKKNCEIKVLSDNKLRKLSYIKIKDIKQYDPNYIVISSHTSKHYKYLNFINNNLEKKIVLVEKPLFNRMVKFREKNNNKIFVNYNLRFHPVISKIKKMIKNEVFLFSSLTYYSYLPDWRKNIDYRLSNSSKKKFGGGILLELSHEIDLVNYLFKLKKIKSIFNSKISNLKIQTDDILNFNSLCKKVKFCTVNLNFFDRHKERKIKIVGKTYTLEGDLISNIILLKKQKSTILRKFKIDNNYTYKKIHYSLIKGNYKNICTLKEGLKIMKFIYQIKNWNDKKK